VPTFPDHALAKPVAAASTKQTVFNPVIVTRFAEVGDGWRFGTNKFPLACAMGLSEADMPERRICPAPAGSRSAKTAKRGMQRAGAADLAPKEMGALAIQRKDVVAMWVPSDARRAKARLKPQTPRIKSGACFPQNPISRRTIPPTLA